MAGTGLFTTFDKCAASALPEHRLSAVSRSSRRICFVPRTEDCPSLNLRRENVAPRRHPWKHEGDTLVAPINAAAGLGG